jgi:hypothetical protein
MTRHLTRVFLLTACLLSTISVSAQDCKWKESKKDPISDQKFLKGKKITVFGDQKFGQSDKKSLDLHLELENGKVVLYTAFERTTLMSDEKVNAPVIVIRLEDKTVITFNSPESFSTKLTMPGITNINFRFEVDKSDITKIAKSNPTALRLSFSGQDFLFEPKEKRAENIKEQFSCMLLELNTL